MSTATDPLPPSISAPEGAAAPVGYESGALGFETYDDLIRWKPPRRPTPSPRPVTDRNVVRVGLYVQRSRFLAPPVHPLKGLL